MKNLLIYILTGIIFFSIIGFFIIIFISEDVLYSSSEVGSECEVLNYTGITEDKVNIVFLTKNTDKKASKRYIDSFLNTKPFSENKNKFNFFYSSYSPECELYEDSALLCYSKELIKNSAVCPNDYIVVLSDPSNKDIRSSAYMNVMSINTNLPETVFVHEFGHVFSNLADEYVPAKLPKGAKNCVEECDDFNKGNLGDPIDCHKGCSESNYYRPSKSSVMRTLSVSDYEEFNEILVGNELKKYSSEVVNNNFSSGDSEKMTGLASGDYSNDSMNEEKEYVLVELDYSNGSFSLADKSLEKGYFSKPNYINDTQYSYETYKNNLSMFSSSINPNSIFVDGFEDNSSDSKEEVLINGGIIDRVSGKAYISVPSEDVEGVSIYDEDEKIFETKTYDVGATSCRVS